MIMYANVVSGYYTVGSVYYVHHPVHENGPLLQTVSQVAVSDLLHNAGIQGLRHSVTVQFNVKMGQTSDLSD
jgi:hypothetical protein